MSWQYRLADLVAMMIANRLGYWYGFPNGKTAR